MVLDLEKHNKKSIQVRENSNDDGNLRLDQDKHKS